MSCILRLSAAFAALACMTVTAFAQQPAPGVPGVMQGKYISQSNSHRGPATAALGRTAGPGTRAGYGSLLNRNSTAYRDYLATLNDPRGMTDIPDDGNGEGRRPFFPPPFIGGGGGGGANPFSVPGDVMRSAAEGIRSIGEANYWGARGAEHWQNAHSMAIDNDLRRTAVFWQKRQIRDSYLAQRYPRPSQEAMARIARMGVPDRLTAQNVDVGTGELVWPAILMQPEYAHDRERVGEIFALRNRGEIEPNDPRIAEAVYRIERMRNTLIEDIASYDSRLYLNARNLLETLSYEATLPGAPAQVASR